MKILITGKNGFIGKTLLNELQKHYNVIGIGREVDLLKRDELETFFKKHKYFDYVIHTAIVGGRISVVDEIDVLYNNLGMYYNLMFFSNYFGKLINFSSGAEFDRTKDIINVSSVNKYEYPLDPYGMSKNIITKSNINGFNFRIFNVFGYYEIETRMIKNSINNYIKKNPIIIQKDLFMDFFYIGDLIKVIIDYMETPEKYNIEYNVINLCYNKKTKLTDIAKYINQLSTYKVPIRILNDGIGREYTGDSFDLDKFSLDLCGLEQGINNTYKKMLKK